MNDRSRYIRGAVLAGAAFGGMPVLMGSAHGAIVINEVAGGGGSSSTSSTYQTDFVELYNTSATPVLLTGYLLQYASASATGTFNQTIYSFGLGSVIGANDYLTINTGTAGTGGAVNPTANGTGSVSLSGSSGSVRLLDDTGATVDLVGYGTITASTLTPPPVRFEGSGPAPGESTTSADFRTGFADTNDNKVDFTAGTPFETVGATSIAVPVSAVPEPATLSLAAAAAVGTLVRRRPGRAV